MGCIISIYDTLSNKTSPIKRKLTITLNKVSSTNMSLEEITQDFSTFLSKVINTQLEEAVKVGDQTKTGLPLASVTEYNFNNSEEILYEIFKEWKDNVKTTNPLISEETHEILWNALESAFFNTKEQIQTLVENFSIDTNPIIDGKPLINFSNISELLNNSDALLNYLNSKLGQIVGAVSFINNNVYDWNYVNESLGLNLVPTMIPFVTNSVALNNNLIGVKQSLWATIVQSIDRVVTSHPLYIKDEITNGWKINEELFKIKSNGKSDYVEIIEALVQKYNGLKVKQLISSGKSSTVKSYINLLLLLNFDSFIKSNYDHTIGVNPDAFNTWGLPKNGEAKYQLLRSSATTNTWAPDNSGETDIEEVSSGTFKILSYSIPFLTVPDGTISQTAVGLYLDTVRINTAAAVVKSLPRELMLKNPITNKSYSIYEWFSRIESNESTFKELLEAILNTKDSNLSAVNDFIYSIHNYLYNPKTGIHNLYTEHKKTIPNLINPEAILLHQFRNTRKATYYFIERNNKRRSRLVDTLLLDTKVGVDFEQLYSNLQLSWANKPKTMEDHVFWSSPTFNNFINFLQEFSKLEFSPRTIVKYKKNLPSAKVGNTELSETTVQNLKQYFLNKVKVVRLQESEDGSVLPPKEGVLDSDEWIERVTRNFSNINEPETSILFSDLDLKELFKAKHNTEVFNTVVQVSNRAGEKYPSLAIVNLASDFSQIIHTYNKSIQNPTLNELTKSMEDFTILLEAGTDEEAKPIRSLSASDNLSIAIFDMFYGQILNQERILVQPYNYADKSKILAQVINYKKLTEGKIDQFTSEIAKKKLIEIYKTHYNALNKKIIRDYNEVFKRNFKNLTEIDKFITSKSWLDILTAVENYNKGKNLRDQIVFVRELHYGLYKKEVSFPKLLKYQIETWTGNKTNQEEFFKQKELEFAKSIKDLDEKFYDITQIEYFKGLNKIGRPYKILNLLKEKFGFTDEDFEITYVEAKDEKGKKIPGFIAYTKEGIPKINKVYLKRPIITENTVELSEPLKRFLWTRNLIMGADSIISVKDASLHPIKSKLSLSPDKVLTAQDLITEENERSIAFYKRMVIGGGSMMRFNQGIENGIPKNIKIACIEDPTKSVFTPSGVIETQKTFDGEIFVSPFGTHNFQQASPGFNYSRILKPLGLSISRYHTSMLKCAFMGINNEMIRNSIDGTFSLEEIMQKMHNVQFNTSFFNPNSKLFNSERFLTNELPKLLENHYFIKNDKLVKIVGIQLIPGQLHNYNILYSDDTTSFQEFNVEVKNYYQLWKLFGGAWSVTKKYRSFIPNENSINLINYLVDNYSNYGINFKEDLVYLLVPEQGIKNGMMNTNPISRLTKNDPTDFSIVEFNTDYLGIQQDSSYDSDESTTSEATQVLSALSENNTNPEYYNAVYETMGRVITESLEKFKELNKKQINNISSIFLRSLARSTTVNNARTLLDNLEEDLKDKIPYSDRTLFKQFISAVMANINREFIKKKISGASMILNGADDMIQLYEDNIGKTYLATDLILIYLKQVENNKIPAEILTQINSEPNEVKRQRLKIQYVLTDPKFKPKEYKSLDAIQPLDVVLVKDENGNIIEQVRLNEIDQYYTFLKRYRNSNFKFFKSYTQSRDLSPEKKSFSFIEQNTSQFEAILIQFLEEGSPEIQIDKELGISNAMINSLKENFIIPNLLIYNQSNINPEIFISYYLSKAAQHKTTFSTDAVKNKFELVFIRDSKPSAGQINEWEEKWDKLKQNSFLNSFHNYLMEHNVRYAELINNDDIAEENKFKVFEKYLERFSNRTFLLLGNGETFRSYDESPTYFDSILQFSDNSFDDLDYGLDIQNPYKNTIKVFNYKHSDQEVILSNPYITQFKAENLSHSRITASTFSNWYISATNRKVYKYYDILLNNPYTSENSLQLLLRKPILKVDYLKMSGWASGTFLIDENGDLVVTTNVKGETTFIGKKVYITTNKPSEENKNKPLIRLDSLGKEMYQLDLFDFGTQEKPSYLFFKTADGKELAFVNRENAEHSLGTFISRNWKRFGIMDLKDSKRVGASIYNSIIDKCDDYRLRSYLRKRLDKSEEFNKTHDKVEQLQIQKEIQQITKNFSETYGSQIFNSWKLSQIALGTRIPAQSGQSYTSVKTIGYMHNGENSVYVSRWQTFIQGSDFDIDKLYMMMFSIQNGLFKGWSPYFDLSTSSTTKDSLELPIPNKYNYQHTLTLTPELEGKVLDLDQVFPELNTLKENLKFPNLSISDRVAILKYVEKYWNKNIHTHIKTKNEAVFNTIRNHNSYYSEDGFNNFRVYQMIKTSRSAKNELSFNSPVTFGDYRKLTTEKEVKVSIYNPMSMLIQQENNYVGRDVIGITATGLKGYFALITYFSNYYAKGQVNITDPQIFLREYTVGETTKVVTRLSGLNLHKKAVTTLQTTLKNALVGKYAKKTLPGENPKFYTEEELWDYIDSIDDLDNPALKLSSLLSAATDNAKELLLADINAGIDFAGMHIFLIMMGFNEIEVAKYMTNPNILKFKSLIQGSFINFGGKRRTVDNLTTTDFIDTNTLSMLSEVEKLKAQNKSIMKQLFGDANFSEFFKQVHSKNEKKIHFMDFLLSFSTKEEFIANLSNRLDSKIALLDQKELTKGQVTKLEIIKNLLLQNATQFTFSEDLAQKFSLYQENLQNDSKFLENFKRIYKHSSELISIGTELAINQGIKATVEEVYKSVQNINNILSNQQSEFLKPIPDSTLKARDITTLLGVAKAINVWHFLDSNIKDGIKSFYKQQFEQEFNETALTSMKSKITEQLTQILEYHVKIDKPYLPTEYISSTLRNALQTGLITDGIDYNRFINPEDTTYQNIVKNYLNLVKYNFNIIDLLDNLPHFKAMKVAFRYGNQILSEEMIAYKFLHTILPTLVDVMTYNKEVTPYKTLKLVRSRGREFSHVSLDSSVIEKSQDLLYELLLQKWLSSLSYNLDFTEFIKAAYKNTSKFNIITSNKNSAELEKVDINNPNDSSFKIDFNTDYGKAKFKYIMETYIIPYLKDYFDSDFFKEYVYRTGESFNMRRMIKFYQTGSNFEITYGVERAMEKLVKNFGNKFELLVDKKNEGIFNPIPMIDLLYIYDKISNLGRYGGNRATVFFDKNRGPNSSAASSFRRYQSFIENDPKFFDQILESIAPNRLKGTMSPKAREILLEKSKGIRQSFYLTLFGYTHKGIRQYVESVPDPRNQDDESNGLPVTRQLINPYFKLVSTLSETEVNDPVLENKNELINTTLTQILSSNGVVSTNCK